MQAQPLNTSASRIPNSRHPECGNSSAPAHTPLLDSLALATSFRDLAPLLHRIAGPYSILQIDVPASDLPNDSPTQDHLERLVLNLVGNAAQTIASRPNRRLHPARQRSGRICVLLQQLDHNLHLEVADNGPGLPMPHAAAFLHPEAQPLSSCRGFVHQIVNDLARSSGASIHIRVRPGKGTSITLTWDLNSNTSDIVPQILSIQGLPETALI